MTAGALTPDSSTMPSLHNLPLVSILLVKRDLTAPALLFIKAFTDIDFQRTLNTLLRMSISDSGDQNLHVYKFQHHGAPLFRLHIMSVRPKAIDKTNAPYAFDERALSRTLISYHHDFGQGKDKVFNAQMPKPLYGLNKFFDAPA